MRKTAGGTPNHTRKTATLVINALSFGPSLALPCKESPCWVRSANSSTDFSALTNEVRRLQDTSLISTGIPSILTAVAIQSIGSPLNSVGRPLILIGVSITLIGVPLKSIDGLTILIGVGIKLIDRDQSYRDADRFYCAVDQFDQDGALNYRERG
jgi:hypothetical protein